ncbi:MAG: hypothetical protein K9M99_11755 [Candidatus Cloacimonetes bacterium]|nr:hypothetical protein [Candidatus Cloacimonadota bacterium]
MKNNIENKIEEVVKKISSKYPKIIIGYNFDEGCYFIWHNNKHLEYEDKEFRRYTGKLLFDYFFEHDIFNVCISYDLDESLKEYKSNDVLDYGISISFKDNGISEIPLEINQPDIRESILFNNNIQLDNFRIPAMAIINTKHNEFDQTFFEVA